MKTISKQEKYLKTQRILRRTRLFYIHLAGYILVVGLISLNFYILEEGPYKSTITALNLSILGTWTVFIIIHGIDVYRRRSLFKKTWEDKKIDEFIDKESKIEIKLWK
ncbi:2TM domain-containing protein [Winogradskyella sp.]|uniref:2TM domain-containing protein n=1 Tax=Winogradskyella sp. TaxID=1883156 RepID=UPI00260A89D4|nr:2TM domain-containing protein [Winogradskyella sp.]